MCFEITHHACRTPAGDMSVSIKLHFNSLPPPMLAKRRLRFSSSHRCLNLIAAVESGLR